MKQNKKYMGSVKVGPKGQIVIPNEVRKMFDIKPGDQLIVLADPKQGIAIERTSVFDQVADQILSGHAGDLYQDHTEEESRTFAEAIKHTISGKKEH